MHFVVDIDYTCSLLTIYVIQMKSHLHCLKEHFNHENNKKSEPPRLSEAEWSVMKPFWDKGSLAACDLYEQLPQNHGWSPKTVKTMLPGW